ncbi:MAG: oatA 2 [Frankiales bacterium]|nr:oatA 2 [Frankiales bacterium]
MLLVTSPGGRNPHERRLDVQGLRGVAVSLVLMNHVLGFPHGGFVGVDVFFVISGYLITRLLLRERGAQVRSSLRIFYARRVRRILPLAMLVLVVTAALSKLLLGPVRAHRVLVDCLWAMGFTTNVHFQRVGTDYFAAFQPPSPVEHFWSLAVEEQFYVVWPAVLLVLLARRGSAGREALVVAVLVGVASFAYGVAALVDRPAATYFSTPARAWELAVGTGLALVEGRVAELPRSWRGVVGWLGATLLILSALATLPTHYPGWNAVAPVLGSALVLVGGTGPSSTWSPNSARFLGTRVLRLVGDRSYSLYLWHLPVAVLVWATVTRSAESKALILLVTLGLSVSTFALVEHRVLRSRWLLEAGPRPSLIGAVVVTVVLAVAAVVVMTDHAPHAPPAPAISASVPTRTQEQQALMQLTTDVRTAVSLKSWPPLVPSRELAPLAQAPEFANRHCSNELPIDIAACTYSLPGADKDAVVLGDSMAISWLPGIRQSLEPRGYRVHAVAFDTCPFAPVDVDLGKDPTRSRRCNQAHIDVMQELAKLRPTLIITSDIETGLLNMRSRHAGAAARDEWAEAVSARVQELRRLGARVVILSPPPSGALIDLCGLVLSTPRDCLSHISQAWYAKREADRWGATLGGAKYVDTSSWFCDTSGRCPIAVHQVPVRWDGYHLTPQYSHDLAPVIGLSVLLDH